MTPLVKHWTTKSQTYTEEERSTMRQRLEKSISLTGQVETITAMDFRRSPGDVLLQTQMGKTFNITKYGVVIAVLSAPESDALELGREIRKLRLAGN